MRIRASFAAERAAAVSTMAGHGHKDEEGQLCRNISLVSVRGSVWVSVGGGALLPGSVSWL